MTFRTDRRSLLLGAGIWGTAAAIGLAPRRTRAQEPAKGGTFRLAIADFDTAETLDPQVNESRFMMNLQYQIRNCLIENWPPDGKAMPIPPSGPSSCARAWSSTTARR
jgi:peptide/nickel transport system substrate-binding protein